MDNPEYFTAIDDPNALRKALLESSKGVILNLKQYHLLMSVRKSKMEMIAILRDQLKELTFLFDKLNKAIPDRDIQYEKELYQASLQKKIAADKPALQKEGTKPALQKPAPQKQGGQQQRPDEDMSDITKLEQTLSSIESKLHALQ